MILEITLQETLQREMGQNLEEEGLTSFGIREMKNELIPPPILCCLKM